MTDFGVNDLYPHGRCLVCGHGLRANKTCQNEECSSYIETPVQTDLLVGDTNPMVRLGIKVIDGERLLSVDCAACGPNVQFTGEGGYRHASDARRAADQHRIDHVNALVRELMESHTPTPMTAAEKDRILGPIDVEELRTNGRYVRKPPGETTDG